MPEQVGRIFIDPVGTRPLKFFLSISSGEKPDSQSLRSPGSQLVPNTIPNHDRILNFHAEAGSGRDKEVGIGFRKVDLISGNNGNTGLDGKKIKCGPGRLHTAACGYRPRDAEIRKPSQQVARTRKSSNV